MAPSSGKTQRADDLAPLNAPPDAHPAPPVISLAQSLPFGQLTWENFERLCYRLSGGASAVETVQRYGRSGQAQQGIDLFVRLDGGAYEVWQVKRYSRFRATDLRRVLKAFEGGSWATRSSALIVAIQADLDDVRLQEAIETEVAAYRARNIRLDVLGGEELSARLRDRPRLVHDFFGRPWTEAFVGKSSALLDELDGAEFAKVRGQLQQVYAAQFGILDQGIVTPLTLSGAAQNNRFGLLERYVEPDVIRRETTAAIELAALPSTGEEGQRNESRQRLPQAVRARSRRAGLETWAMESERLALVGDAGIGKSTFLRALALDLLGEQTLFPRMAGKWGGLIPLVLPFARWSRATAAAGGHVGLKDIARLTWQPLLTADLVGLLDRAIEEGRILLLIDGLDEWADEQAARTTLTTILTLSGAHRTPTIATGRPRGLQKIGALPADWSAAELAPLSPAQRRVLAGRWFAQHLLSTTEMVPATAAVDLETDRFLQGLQQEPGLLELSETPLLLLGLVGLALRHHVLPRTRVQALGRLVDMLIEEHPQRRATAAGDPAPRFNILQDADVRRSALATIALASREEGGDAGLEKSRLRRILVDHLVGVEGLSAEIARRGAEEILAINAETVGLLIEKAPGEIGFAHASLEEFLAATAILSQPLAQMVHVFRARCGDPRWRYVLGDLAALVGRADELEQIVAGIEDVSLDPVSGASRDHLLALIAFTASSLSPHTAIRLANACFKAIEGPGWMAHRQRLLRSVPPGLGRSSLAPAIEERLQGWAPKQSRYASFALDFLAALPPSADVLQVLLRGLGLEDGSDRLAAACLLGQHYKSWPDFTGMLTTFISGGADYRVAAAALLALVESDARSEPAIAHTEAALGSNSALLRAIGLLARVRRDVHTLADQAAILALGRSLWLDEDGARGLLTQALVEGWPDDPTLMEAAIRALRHQEDLFWRDAAYPYLITCGPTHEAMVHWLSRELDDEYPLNIGHGSWAWLVPFARNHPIIMDKLVDALRRDKPSIHSHQAWRLTAELGEPRLRDLALERVNDGGFMDAFWNLRPLLAGWRGDPAVEALIEEIKSWPDDRLGDIFGLLPDIIPDKAQCRARLLGACANEHRRLRYDFLADGFLALGCDHTDQEVVTTLLTVAENTLPDYDPEDRLIRGFGAHPDVRAFALKRLKGPSPPVVALLQRYGNDPEFRPALLHYFEALPTTLRYVLAQAARTDGERRPSSAAALAGYDQEVDADLKVTLAIGHFEAVGAKGAVPPDQLARLARDVAAVGPDLEERRAAAFAGLAVLGRADVIDERTDSDHQLRISPGGAFEASPALLQLICEKWSDLNAVLTGGVSARLGRFSSRTRDSWELLAPYVAVSDAATRDFLSFCETDDKPLREAELRALAALRPRTTFLERCCWTVLEATPHHADLKVASARMAAVQILAEQFPARDDIFDRLAVGAAYPKLPDARMLGMALYAPDPQKLQSFVFDDTVFDTVGTDWPTQMGWVCRTDEAPRVVEVAEMMLSRRRHGPWDFQAVMNAMLVSRLQRDAALAQLFGDRILGASPPVHVLASVPRLLAAAGPLSVKVRERCLTILDRELARSGPPRVGFDIFEDRLESLSHSLFEALSAGSAL